MAVGWTWAFDTPFKWTKQIASHFGGTRQGMAISWPDRIKDAGGIRHQFHHVIDIVPTILEATGIQAPVMVNGIDQKPIEGVSMAYTFDKANANAPSTRKTQYFEMFGNRAIYHDGWMAGTTPPQPPWLLACARPDVVNGYNWELYNIAKDYSQDNDLAAKMPDKLRELQELFLVEAENTTCSRWTTASPLARPHRGRAHRGPDRLHLLRKVVRPSLRQRPQHSRQVLLHHRRDRHSAGRCRGHAQYDRRPVRRLRFLSAQRQTGLYLQPSRLALPLGRPEALTPGKHTIVFDFTYDGPGFGKGGTGVLSVDGKAVDTQEMPHTMPFILPLTKPSTSAATPAHRSTTTTTRCRSGLPAS